METANRSGIVTASLTGNSANAQQVAENEAMKGRKAVEEDEAGDD